MNWMLFRLHATDTLHNTLALGARVAWMPRIYYANAGDPIGVQGQSSVMPSSGAGYLKINIAAPSDTLYFAFPSEVPTPTVTIFNVVSQLWEGATITAYSSSTEITNPFGIPQLYTVFQVQNGGLSGGNLANYTDPINGFVELHLVYSLTGLLLDS